MLTKDELLTEVMDRNFDLSKENNVLREQIKELKTQLDKANAQLQKGHVSDVIGVFEASIWKLRTAAKDWVFVTNGEKWSNNNNEAGDNYGSFIEGGLWVLKQLKEAQK